MSPIFPVLLLFAAWAPVQDADSVSLLISALGDESITVRDSALRSLIAHGPPVIPRLREALQSRDVEVQKRALCALAELEREEKLAAVMQARPPVSLCLDEEPLARALDEIAAQTGIRFEGAADLRDRPISVSLQQAPLMQALDALAEAADLQWSFESDSIVSWRRQPAVVRPSCYLGGFRIALSRIDVYRSWDYQQGHGLCWMLLEARMEPGHRPVGVPRFDVTEVRDESENELSLRSDVQDCPRRGCFPEGLAGQRGSVCESSPFLINPFDRRVKKLSKIRGRVTVLFPLDPTPLEIVDLCEDSSVSHGDLELQVNEILDTSLKLTLVSKGDPSHLTHHLDVESLVLIDAEGREYVHGADFEVCAFQMSAASLRYCVDFREHARVQPVALRFRLAGQIYEKVVPFEFRDVLLP